jgi:hypothetical protein
MQELVRKTIEVIRSRPILLLPLLGADQTVLYLEVLRRIASKKIMVWSMTTTTRSVTGAIIQLPVAPVEARNRALLLLGPIGWTNNFVHIVLFTAAFVVTASLIRGAPAGAPLQWRDAFDTAWKRRAGILFFALKFFGAIAAAAALSVALAELDRVTDWLRVAGPWATGVWSIAIASLIAWLLAPPALRLVNPALAKPLQAQLKRSARLVCILCGVTSTVLSLALQNLKFPPEVLSSFNAWFWNYPVPSLESALIALPYLPMWIVLALLAFAQEPMIEIPSPS